MKASILYYFICISLIAGTLVFVVTGRGTYQKTEAEITSIEHRNDGVGDESDNTIVLVKFKVDGRVYTDVELGSYWATMHVGDSVTIEYEIHNPEMIRVPSAKVMQYLPMTVGVAGIIYAIVKKRKEA